MEPIRFAIVGSGWRSEFYARVARALPDSFEISGVLTRDAGRAATIATDWNVPAHITLDDLLAAQPAFVVVSVPWSATPDMLRELTERQVPVLTETPPAPDVDGLRALRSLEQRFRHRPQAVKVWRPPPRSGRPRIDLAVDEAVPRKDGEHEPRPIGLPLGRHRSIRHPQAEKLSALIGRSVVDRAALSRRAMLAPDTGRLVEFGQRINFAAERAGAALASGRGGIGRNEHGG